jgi:hypothetical protein
MQQSRRKGMKTPLTDYKSRQELISSGKWRKNSTHLDRALTPFEADSLEEYAYCESILTGRARTSDYSGDRVKSSRIDLAPIDDRDFTRLKRHARIKNMLPIGEKYILEAFARQQRGDLLLSDAQLGLILEPSARNATHTWHSRIADAARVLATLAETANATR